MFNFEQLKIECELDVQVGSWEKESRGSKERSKLEKKEHLNT